ncbi:MAG: carboxypeptidase-like regulatory domain-containing protein [Nitrospirota bacterium]
MSAHLKIIAYAAAAAVMVIALIGLGGCATSASEASVGTASNSGVRGVVMTPVEGAYIFVYEKGAEPHGPPYVMSEPTKADGSFEVGLPDGEYTIVARKHKDGEPGSPLRKGKDKKSPAVDITVKGGVIQAQNLVIRTKTDNKKYFGAWAPSDTSISGKILDSDGNPMIGFRVQVYTYAQMSERPKYVSDKTGPDGKFVVYLPKGGTYYLQARDTFGGPPKVGDFYGRYDEGTVDPSGVMLKKGQRIKDLDITVHKVW